jgi:hypothetical protein
VSFKKYGLKPELIGSGGGTGGIGYGPGPGGFGVSPPPNVVPSMIATIAIIKRTTPPMILFLFF